MSKQYDFDKQTPVIKKKELSESVVKEPKQYDFSEAVVKESSPWFAVGRGLKTMAGTNMFRGAGIGSGVGALAGMANNAMKSDKDPTKKGMLSSALKGAAVGAGAGALVGSAAGHTARSKMGRQLQNSVMAKGKQDVMNNLVKTYANDLAQQGYNQTQIKNMVQKARNDGTVERWFNEIYKKSNDNYGWITNKFKSYKDFVDYIPEGI